MRKSLSIFGIPALLALPAAALSLASFPTNDWVEVTPKWKYVQGITGAFQERGWCTMRFRNATNSIVFYEGFGPSTHGNYCIYANSLYEYHPPMDSVEMLALSNWYCNQGNPTALPENQTTPTPMDRHTFSQFAYCPLNDLLYLSHGASGSNNHPHDLWAYNFSTRSWKNLGSAPGGTQGYELVGEANLTYYPKTQELLLFKNRKSVYAYNVGTGVWRTITPKGATTGTLGTRAGFDPLRNRFFFYGIGWTDNESGTKTFVFYEAETDTWVDVPESGTWPGAKAYSSMEYNSKWDVYMLHGGFNQNETWIYSPTAKTWSKLATAHSTPLNGKQMTLAYDPAHDLLINEVKGKMYVLRYEGSATAIPKAKPGLGQFRIGGDGLAGELAAAGSAAGISILDTRGHLIAARPGGAGSAWSGRDPHGLGSGIFFVRMKDGAGERSFPVLLSR